MVYSTSFFQPLPSTRLFSSTATLCPKDRRSTPSQVLVCSNNIREWIKTRRPATRLATSSLSSKLLSLTEPGRAWHTPCPKLNKACLNSWQGKWLEMRQFQPVQWKPLGTPRDASARGSSVSLRCLGSPALVEPPVYTTVSRPSLRTFSQAVPGAGEAAFTPAASGWCQAIVRSAHPKTPADTRVKGGDTQSEFQATPLLRAPKHCLQEGPRILTDEAARESFCKELLTMGCAARSAKLLLVYICD